MEPTKRQLQVLDFVESYQFENGRSPTLREIKGYLGVSSDNGVLKHLNALQKKGFLTKDDTPRGIKLLDAVRQKLQATVINLPVLGHIPAGGPVMTEEYIEKWCSVDSGRIKHPKDTFMLRVSGESMINAGVLDGDLIIADAKKDPRHGDIVVALIDNENTVKRLVSKQGKFFLHAENPKYDDLFPVSNLEIQGVVIGLVRSY